MKLWQLFSIARDDEDSIARVAASRAPWKSYERVVKEYPRLIDTQDRAVLDSLVDHDFAVAVLRQLKKTLYLTPDNWLRSRPRSPTDREIGVAEAFERYGGEAVEEAFERGSIHVREPKTPPR